MKTIQINIYKIEGEYTGRIREEIVVIFPDEHKEVIEYGANFGFDFEGRRYKFKTNSKGGLDVIDDTNKKVNIGKRGATIDMENFKKVSPLAITD